MRKPSIFDYLIGNVVSFLVIFSLFCLVTWWYWQGEIPDLTWPILLGFATIWSNTSRERIESARNWARAVAAVSAPSSLGAQVRQTTRPQRGKRSVLWWFFIVIFGMPLLLVAVPVFEGVWSAIFEGKRPSPLPFSSAQMVTVIAGAIGVIDTATSYVAAFSPLSLGFMGVGAFFVSIILWWKLKRRRTRSISGWKGTVRVLLPIPRD